MKVIDLLNKISNGEEVPKKIKCYNTIYTFDEYKGEVGYVDKNREIYRWFAKEIDCDTFEDLNKEIEIIEEKKKIEKFEFDKDLEYGVYQLDLKGLNINLIKVAKRLNEIIDYINNEYTISGKGITFNDREDN